jgi:trehalose 6-phosphate phosphatase
MKPLLSAEGEAALSQLIASDPLIALDFDGTLSPMVMLSWQARMPAGVVSGLFQLCETMSVAVITGRNLDDVLPRLLAKPKYVVGNHGAEGLPGNEENEQTYRAVCEGWQRQIRDELQWDKLDSGLMIEYKPYSICLHYRLARDRMKVSQHIDATLPKLDPVPTVIAGMQGINLMPPGAPNKRTSLETLLEIEGKHTAFYIGDDDADEDIFRDAPPEWLTVRVGHDPKSAARFFLRHQSEMTECLHTMVRMAKNAA